MLFPFKINQIAIFFLNFCKILMMVFVTFSKIRIFVVLF